MVTVPVPVIGLALVSSPSNQLLLTSLYGTIVWSFPRTFINPQSPQKLYPVASHFMTVLCRGNGDTNFIAFLLDLQVLLVLVQQVVMLHPMSPPSSPAHSVEMWTRRPPPQLGAEMWTRRPQH